mgnify:FL=1
MRRAWSDAEDEYIKINSRYKTDKEMAERLGRTENAIRCRKSKLRKLYGFGPNYLYLACTPDRYELPIFVAGSLSELADMTGYSKSSISTLLYRPATKTDRNYGYIFRKVLGQ